MLSEEQTRDRQQMSQKPGWLSYFRGGDRALAGDIDGTLSYMAEALSTFIEHDDRVGIKWAQETINFALRMKGLSKETERFGRLIESWNQRMIHSQLIWDWWRLNNLPGR